MIVTFQHFHNLKFPLFVLPSDDWWEQDRVLFLGNRVIDEKNMPGETLGVRRLQSHRKDLLPLTKAITSLPDLIQCKTKFFIDSEGNPFIYNKTYNSRLKTHRIKRIERKEIASLLWIEGVPSPFTIAHPPAGHPPFVRMLQYEGAPWIVYDYVRRQVKDTYRKV